MRIGSSKMAMSLQELFYYKNKPAYFVHFELQASISYSHSHQILLLES
jgi:hypothetical protein